MPRGAGPRVRRCIRPDRPAGWSGRGLCYLLADRNVRRVLLEPAAVARQVGVEIPARGEVTRRAIFTGELGVELEHVGQLIRAREPERAVRRGGDRVVADLLAERIGQASR